VEVKNVTKTNAVFCQFKFKIALEAVRGLKTISQIGSEQGVHPSQIGAWKKQLLQEGAAVFTNQPVQKEREQAAKEAELYEQIGRLKMELEWLKKKSAPFA
jgi:transposase-like protein